MINNFFYRVLIIATLVVGFMFFCVDFEHSNLNNVIVLAFVFFSLCVATYKSFKNLSIEHINEILFIEKFKKFGINLDEE